MSIPDFMIIAAIIAVARWVIRSVREPSTDAADAAGKPAAPQPAKPAQKTLPKRAATGGRAAAAAMHHADPLSAWNVVLDVPQDAPRSEIQAAAKRRLAQAVSSGDHAAVTQITRAAASGLKHKVLRSADARPRGRRDP